MSLAFQSHCRIRCERPSASPSPLNGERAGVRGELAHDRSFFLNGSTAVRVASEAHFPDVARALAGHSRSFHAQSGRLLAANSRSVEFQCCAISDKSHGLFLLPVAREGRAGCHPVQGCNAPRHKTNRGCIRRLGVGGGICKRKISGRAGWPIISFPPRWIYAGAGGEFGENSWQVGVARGIVRFKSLFAFSPLALTLSSLRGEGTVVGGSTSSSDLRLATTVICRTNFAEC